MRSIITSLLGSAGLLACIFANYMPARAQEAEIPAPTQQSVGLVLSGGGAKGIAHIGVIQALEDNDIPIDYLTGTSMGAIVGGMYAAGYTPREMMDLLRSRGFAYWSTGRIDERLTYYFMRRPLTPAFAHIDIPLGKDSISRGNPLIPSSLISPLPMNFAFMELFSAYTAQCEGDFDKLFVPFRCVTSDVIAKHKIVCSHGHLGDAIRASMSFPGVFQPIMMDGVPVYDGGIYDNFPFDVMRETFAPGIMIGVDVHSTGGPAPAPSNGLITQLENMIMQESDYDLPPDEGIKIRVDLNEFGLLDFGAADTIYAIGYNKAMEFIDSIKGRVTSRIPARTRELRRQVFKGETPRVCFDSVYAHGGTLAQNRYLERLFAPRHGQDTFGIEHARKAYYRAITPGRLRNLVPQADFSPQTGVFTLDLWANPKNNFGFGAGGYLTSTPNSSIFLSVDYSTLSHRSADAILMGWLGQSYLAAQFDGRLYLGTQTPTALDLQAVVMRRKFYETDKLFYEDTSPAFITHYESFGRLRYGWAMGNSAKGSVEAGGGQVHDKFYANDRADFAESGRERTTFNLGQAALRLEYNTLDNESYPTMGRFANLTVMGVIGRYLYRFRDNPMSEVPEGDEALATPNEPVQLSEAARWIQAELRLRRFWAPAKHFSFGVTVDALYSSRKLLNSYYASLVNAPSYEPAPSMQGLFNKRFRANSFVAAGIVPIWRPFQRVQARLTASAFLPFRRIEQAPGGSMGAVYGRWFRNPEFFGQLDVVVNLPFASIVGYVNYLSWPSGNWNVGLSFGLPFSAAQFLR